MKNQRPYRPSNGTEGCIFYETFCHTCLHEAGERECDIYTRSLAFDIDDDEYPGEWIYYKEQPTCTAWQSREEYFKALNARKHPARDKKQTSLF